MNILIVDNEIVQVENLRIGLISRGFHVLRALNGQDALNLIENDPSNIDLVITDYAMPEMDGIELLQNIRWKHKDLPVILMTAYGHRGIIIDAMQNQCNGFIDKPFSLNQLLQEIERVRLNLIKNAKSGASEKTKHFQPFFGVP
jgi:DNA-binding NtrC family response regulator